MPPLYAVKIGGREQYVVKESQFEELLVRERVKDIEVTDRAGATQKLTEARYQRFSRALHEFEGWAVAPARRLRHRGRPTSSIDAPASSRPRPLLTGEIDAALAALDAERLRGRGRRERPTDGARDQGDRARDERRDASSSCRPSCSASPVYANLRKTYARLVEIVGAPPFTLELGKKTRQAETFEALRDDAPRAREGGHPGAALQGPRRDGSRGARRRRRWTRPGGC